jgi:enoyl-CoA hydratase
MGLTGARLRTADCIAAGVATHYVPTERFAELIEALEIEKLDEDGERIDELLDALGAPAGSSDLSASLGLIDAAFAGDDPGAILKRLEDAGDDWSKKQASILRSKSPTSVAVTLAALRKGVELDFRGVMAQDLRVSTRFLAAGSDFYEGVRAVLIDKDNAPTWGASASDIDGYFKPLDDEEEMSFLD